MLITTIDSTPTRKIVEATLVGVILTVTSYTLGNYFAGLPLTEINYLEGFSVLTSYICTWLCVLQSRWNYPIGAVSVAALCVLFYQSSLFSSMMLQAYLFPTLLWGWFRWRPDHVTRPVTFVAGKWWPAYIGFAVATWFGLSTLMTSLGAAMPGMDSAILGLSILAQFLLDQKKIETWAVWFLVNVIAIYVYWNAGLAVLTVQFVFFLLNTFLGAYTWHKTLKEATDG